MADGSGLVGRLWVAAALVVLLAAAPSQARNCTRADRMEADRQLWLNERDKALAIATAMPWGTPAIGPSATNEFMLAQRDYVIRYDGDLRLPLFTAERVDARRLGRTPRTDCFRPDVRVPGGFASTPADYDEPIFDQGHLAAFANQDTSVVAGDNSFIMTNMAPQTCQLNRGIWQILEGVVRLWAKDAGTVYVVSGSVFDRDGDGSRDPDGAAALMTARNGTRRVAVPTAFYKIVAREAEDGGIETLAFILPHDQANPEGDAAVGYLGAHIATLADIERLTGLRFFTEARFLSEGEAMWAFERSRLPRSLCHAAPRANFDAIWAEPWATVSEPSGPAAAASVGPVEVVTGSAASVRGLPPSELGADPARGGRHRVASRRVTP